MKNLPLHLPIMTDGEEFICLNKRLILGHVVIPFGTRIISAQKGKKRDQRAFGVYCDGNRLVACQAIPIVLNESLAIILSTLVVSPILELSWVVGNNYYSHCQLLLCMVRSGNKSRMSYYDTYSKSHCTLL